jgi:hypothetical protein
MQTITLGKARYTIRKDRKGFLEQALKFTGKHKPVRPKGALRKYPRYGAQCSTAEYVREYFLANASVYAGCDSKGNLWGDRNEYVQSIINFFQPLSTDITVPQGEYSMELVPCSTK